jgi:hypothetical protein
LEVKRELLDNRGPSVGSTSCCAHGTPQEHEEQRQTRIAEHGYTRPLRESNCTT